MKDAQRGLSVSVIDSDPFHGEYLGDVIAAAVPFAQIKSYSRLSDALHAIARRCGAKPAEGASHVLFVDASLLAAHRDASGESIRLLRSLTDLRVIAMTPPHPDNETSATSAVDADELLLKPCDAADVALALTLSEAPLPVTAQP